jgi:hypothetical protein
VELSSCVSYPAVAILRRTDSTDQIRAQEMKMILKYGKVNGRVIGYSNQDVMTMHLKNSLVVG